MAKTKAQLLQEQKQILKNPNAPGANKALARLDVLIGRRDKGIMKPGDKPKVTAGPKPGTPAAVGQDQRTLADTAGTMALDNLKTTGLDQSFQPTITPRMNEGDLLAARQATEDAVYNRLTRNMSRDYERDRQQTEQDLYNRGIPMQGNDATGKPTGWYQRPEYQGLNERYDNARLNAADTARQAGLGEYSTMFGIGETARANDVTLPQQVRNQQLGEVGALSTLGLPGTISFEQLKDADKDRIMQKVLAQIQAKTAMDVAGLNANTQLKVAGMNRGGGGGEDLDNSPFNSSIG